MTRAVPPRCPPRVTVSHRRRTSHSTLVKLRCLPTDHLTVAAVAALSDDADLKMKRPSHACLWRIYPFRQCVDTSQTQIKLRKQHAWACTFGCIGRVTFDQNLIKQLFSWSFLETEVPGLHGDKPIDCEKNQPLEHNTDENTISIGQRYFVLNDVRLKVMSEK